MVRLITSLEGRNYDQPIQLTYISSVSHRRLLELTRRRAWMNIFLKTFCPILVTVTRTWRFSGIFEGREKMCLNCPSLIYCSSSQHLGSWILIAWSWSEHDMKGSWKGNGTAPLQLRPYSYILLFLTSECNQKLSSSLFWQLCNTHRSMLSFHQRQLALYHCQRLPLLPLVHSMRTPWIILEEAHRFRVCYLHLLKRLYQPKAWHLDGWSCVLQWRRMSSSSFLLGHLAFFLPTTTAGVSIKFFMVLLNILRQNNYAVWNVSIECV